VRGVEHVKVRVSTVKEGNQNAQTRNTQALSGVFFPNIGDRRCDDSEFIVLPPERQAQPSPDVSRLECAAWPQRPSQVSRNR